MIDKYFGFRQKLRETSIELKDLEAKLRAAYVTKELAAQLAEKEAAKMEEKIREQTAHELQRSLWQQDEELERQRDLEEFQRKLRYRTELQEQMIEAEKQRQEAFKEFLREKKMVDDIVRQIQEEDMREMEQKMINMQKTQEEIEEFRKAREAWKQKERMEMEEENRRLAEYVQMQDMAQQQKMELMRQKEEEKAKVMEKIATALHVEQMKRKEREEIIQELLEEEARLAAEKKEQEEIEKQLRHRIEMRQQQKEYQRQRMEQLKREAAKESEERQRLLAKFAEDDRIEQLTAERRRLKVIEHRRAVERELEERRARRAEEMRKLIRLVELEKEEEKARLRLIEEERLRMLKEHATQLLGYLPRGVLREDDLPHLGSDFVEKLAGPVVLCSVHLATSLGVPGLIPGWHLGYFSRKENYPKSHRAYTLRIATCESNTLAQLADCLPTELKVSGLIHLVRSQSVDRLRRRSKCGVQGGSGCCERPISCLQSDSQWERTIIDIARKSGTYNSIDAWYLMGWEYKSTVTLAVRFPSSWHLLLRICPLPELGEGENKPNRNEKTVSLNDGARYMRREPPSVHPTEIRNSGFPDMGSVVYCGSSMVDHTATTRGLVFERVRLEKGKGVGVGGCWMTVDRTQADTDLFIPSLSTRSSRSSPKVIPQLSHTDRAAAVCWRGWFQLLQIEGRLGLFLDPPEPSSMPSTAPTSGSHQERRNDPPGLDSLGQTNLASHTSLNTCSRPVGESGVATSTLLQPRLQRIKKNQDAPTTSVPPATDSPSFRHSTESPGEGVKIKCGPEFLASSSDQEITQGAKILVNGELEWEEPSRKEGATGEGEVVNLRYR
uniref:Meiosis-specific nuclear structural protein 1 n=1 Tax=Timema monikensis TaxID=170555 RepID=A0A7R9HKA8_9NEOP|nr:unnamed protein product [Timema monikensis]